MQQTSKCPKPQIRCVKSAISPFLRGRRNSPFFLYLFCNSFYQKLEIFSEILQVQDSPCSKRIASATCQESAIFPILRGRKNSPIFLQDSQCNKNCKCNMSREPPKYGPNYTSRKEVLPWSCSRLRILHSQQRNFGYKRIFDCKRIFVCRSWFVLMGWLQLVGSIKLQVSFS